MYQVAGGKFGRLKGQYLRQKDGFLPMDCKLLLGSLSMALCLGTMALIMHSWSVLLDLSGQDSHGFVLKPGFHIVVPVVSVVSVLSKKFLRQIQLYGNLTHNRPIRQI